MKIGILGTGNLAVALGKAWAAAGHTILVTGRDHSHADAAAAQIGGASVEPADLAGRADVVVVAIAWDGLAPALALVGGESGALAGKTVIDCTNAVDFATGRLIPETGSAAEVAARVATGAHVVKALHLYAGTSWPADGEPVVAICGDDAGALRRTEALIADLGGRAAVIGGLDAARQAEEAAGFVMRLVGAGVNPRFAVPDVDPALLGR